MTETLSFTEYCERVRMAKRAQPYWRRGQAYFNVLAIERPDLSEQIRGGEIDPFYLDGRVAAFKSWALANWEPTPKSEGL